MQEIDTKELNGNMHADVPLTADRWLEVLRDSNTPKGYIDTLLKFYYEPGHEATCKDIGENYGLNTNTVNNSVWQFGRYVQNRYGFSIIDDDEKVRFWLTVMDGESVSKGLFTYRIKDELCEAIRQWLYFHLVETYRNYRKIVPIKGEYDGSEWNELYKWELITSCQSLDMLKQAELWKDTNLYYVVGDRKVVIDLLTKHKDEYRSCLERLCREDVNLSERLAEFRKEVAKIVDKNLSSKANDERIASTIPACHNPQKYTFYKNDVYGKLCKYLGINSETRTSYKFPHFLELLQPLKDIVANDSELKGIVNPYIHDQLQSDLLLAQDVCWSLFQMSKGFLDLPPKKFEKNSNSDNSMNTEYNKCIELLRSNKNLILTGAPGTGKTYLARHITAEMIGCKQVELDKSGHFGFVQFHPSYDYTDFVEGLRPIKSKDSNAIGFERKDGVFKEFCENALKETGNKTPYIFVIDEINRGEISKIFGELFFSIDPGYRGKEGAVRTQYANLQTTRNAFDLALDTDTCGHFFVPENVYIIGTMNDIDRSVESMDFAMRRRFAWEEVTADESMAMLNESSSQLEGVDSDTINELQNRMQNLNDAIIGKYHKDSNVARSMRLGTAYQIGGSYFLKFGEYYKNGKVNAFDKLWKNHIKNVVSEYLRGNTNYNEQLDYLEKAYNDGAAHDNDNIEDTENA